MSTPRDRYRLATKCRRAYMAEARDCMRRCRETGDGIYQAIAAIHVSLARKFNRAAWRLSR